MGNDTEATLKKERVSTEIREPRYPWNVSASGPYPPNNATVINIRIQGFMSVLTPARLSKTWAWPLL